jgi:hypothetical protein
VSLPIRNVILRIGCHHRRCVHRIPLPARKLARNAQNSLGFYIALTVRDKGKGIRAIRIDPELVSERTSLGHLNRNETKIASTITFAHEMAAARP